MTDKEDGFTEQVRREMNKKWIWYKPRLDGFPVPDVLDAEYLTDSSEQADDTKEIDL
jgi:hypothetical protein